MQLPVHAEAFGERAGAGGAELHMASDPNRDQSYFLFSTTQEQLNFLRFPLGHLVSKAETRALAADYGLSVADKPDSQDICFVPDGDYAAVVKKARPAADTGGEIVDEFIKLKRMEWVEYCRHVSDWEIQRYLKFF